MFFPDMKSSHWLNGVKVLIGHATRTAALRLQGPRPLDNADETLRKGNGAVGRHSKPVSVVSYWAEYGVRPLPGQGCD